MLAGWTPLVLLRMEILGVTAFSWQFAVMLRRMLKKRILQATVGVGLVAVLAACTSFGNGTHYIGNGKYEVKPGLYTSTVPSGGFCTIERKQVNDIGDAGNDAESGGQIFIQVLPADIAVVSLGCGIWAPPKATSYNPDRATAKSGVFRIPTDLLPGTYTAPGASGCAWARVSSFKGDPSSVIAENPSPGPNPKVTIAKTDVGFLTNPCGGWRRIGP